MQSQQTKKESTTPTPPRSPRARRRRAILMAAIAILTVATTLVARYGASRAPSAAPITTSEEVTVTAPLPAPDPIAAVQQPETGKVVAEKPKKAPVVKKTPVVTTAHSREDAAPLPPAAVDTAPGDGELASRTVVAPAAESTATPNTAGEAVTISGCLETTIDGAEFRLTDTEGVDAPKARSWRSGFLKKRTAPVQLVELSDPKGMQKYVGRRVVATGLLTSKELRVRSLLPAGSSCKTN